MQTNRDVYAEIEEQRIRINTEKIQQKSFIPVHSLDFSLKYLL